MRVLGMVLITVGLFGCSKLHRQEKGGMTNISINFHRAEKDKGKGAGILATDPATISNVNCFGVFVEYPEGDPKDTHCLLDNADVVRAATMGGLISVDDPLTLPVKDGLDRRFKIVGFYESTTVCGPMGFDFSPGTGTLSNGFVIGEFEADIGQGFGASHNVTISLDTNKKVIDCTGPLFDFNGHSLPCLHTDHKAEGGGTAADPYLICSADQLKSLADNSADFGHHYKMVSNIDMTTYYAGGGAEFMIGGCGGDACSGGGNDTYFYGNFDGNGFEVQNFKITSLIASETSGYGLFAVTNSAANVRNLWVSSGVITPPSATFVGMAVGANYGTVTNVFTSGSVGSSSYIGGVVGSNHGTVNYSYSSASVSTTTGWGGGIVGTNAAASLVDQCYTSSPVSGGNDLGGVAGDNAGTIQNSYALGGSVSGSFDVGGFVGDNTGTVDKSYAAISVFGTGSTVGGFVGTASGTFTYVFAAGDVTGLDSGNPYIGGFQGSAGGTLTDAFRSSSAVVTNNSTGGTNTYATSAAVSNFYDDTNAPLASWDFSSVWLEHSGSFPTLR